jgi:hypothetical protein
MASEQLIWACVIALALPVALGRGGGGTAAGRGGSNSGSTSPTRNIGSNLYKYSGWSTSGPGGVPYHGEGISPLCKTIMFFHGLNKKNPCQVCGFGLQQCGEQCFACRGLQLQRGVPVRWIFSLDLPYSTAHIQ